MQVNADGKQNNLVINLNHFGKDFRFRLLVDLP